MKKMGGLYMREIVGMHTHFVPHDWLFLYLDGVIIGARMIDVLAYMS